MKHLLLALLVIGFSNEREAPATDEAPREQIIPGNIGIDPELAKQREGGLEIQQNPDFAYDTKENSDGGSQRGTFTWPGLVPVPSSIGAYRPVSIEIDPKDNTTITWSAVESHRMKLPNNHSPKSDPFLCLDDQCYRFVKSQKKLPD